MLVYIIVLLLLLFPLFFKREQSNRVYDKYYWFEFLVLFLLMGLRFRVGGDSIRYETYYTYANDLNQLFLKGAWNITEGFQPLWTIYQAACKTVSDDFVIVQLVNAFIVNGIIFYYANKNVRQRFTFVVLYYFLLYPYFNTEIMRESLAVVVFMMGYKYLVEKKYIRYYLACSVAFMFHASAIFLFILPVIYPILSRLRGWKSYVLPLVISLVVSYYISSLLDFVNSTLFMDNSMLHEKSDQVMESVGLNIFGITMQLIYMFPLFFSMHHFQKQENNSENFVLTMYFFVSIIGMIFLPLVRLSNYFSILFLCMYCDVIADTDVLHKYRTIVILSLCILLCSRLSYYCQGMVGTNGKSKEFKMYDIYIPYHSIFDKEYDERREKAIELQF